MRSKKFEAELRLVEMQMQSDREREREKILTSLAYGVDCVLGMLLC